MKNYTSAHSPCPLHGGNPVAHDDYEVAFSSGGCTATLAGVGTFLACEMAGINDWRRIFGVSGGAIIASLSAVGLSAKELVHLALDTDFASLVDINQGLFSLPVEFLRRCSKALGFQHEPRSLRLSPDWVEKPWTGLCGTSALGDIIQKTANRTGLGANWPKNFTTMATTRDGSPVVFNADGVSVFHISGGITRLSDKPVPLHLAVRASSSIPGVMSALEFKGVMLYDGAMSRDGLCPVGVLIRHFAADPRKIIACRVGEDSLKPILGRLHHTAKLLWRVHPQSHWEKETAGVIEIRPPVDHVHTLKFGLSRDDKWLAIMISCLTSLETLAFEGILEGEQRCLAHRIYEAFGYWRDLRPAPTGKPQLISIAAERVLAEHGWF